MNRKVEQMRLFERRGGKRRGAGRKPKGERAGAPHQKRPALARRYPVHVTLRVGRDIGNLRQEDGYHAIRKAAALIGDRDEFRITQLSIQSNHVHMLVEAEDERALAWNLQRFQISAAKHINGTIRDEAGRRRLGTVFPDRYHASIITNPKQARNVLQYILSNFRRHHEDQTGVARTWKVDWYSSAITFTGWREYSAADFPKWVPSSNSTYVPFPVSPARTWLLNVGWRRAGDLSCLDVPARAH